MNIESRKLNLTGYTITVMHHASGEAYPACSPDLVCRHPGHDAGRGHRTGQTPHDPAYKGQRAHARSVIFYVYHVRQDVRKGDFYIFIISLH